jgi:hypothetical protein
MGMRFIPTRVHGVLDYVHGAALLAAPELLRTKDEPRATLVSRLAGGGATVSTLMTDFEFGAVKAIPVPAHLMLDAVSGALLASAPWLVGYARGGTRYWLPHAFVGAAEVLAAAATKTEPSYYKAKPELADVFRGLLKAKRGSGQRRTGSSGGTYGGVVGLAAGGLGAGALILFLLRRTRGDAREEVEEAPEAVSSEAEEYGMFSRTEAEPQEAMGHPANQEGGAVEAQEGGAVTGDSTDDLLTVVGVLAKMGEAFEETGGGRFILSSEDEGNFDLRGKEDELDEVYQQQIRARVVGRIVDEDSQPRKMEVDEVEPA